MNKDSTEKRADGRAPDEMRPASIEVGALKFADGSARISVGDTIVLVAASLESRVPPFLSGTGSGWATAEYAMLPRATSTRSRREVSRGRPSGRTAEIQRLIGRSLRAVLDLKAMPDKTLTIDCDVIQADGGTRTASITGAYVAAAQALGDLVLRGEIERWPFRQQVAAISAGIVDGRELLDLEASEDQGAQVDLNVVATPDGELIEVQGTAERRLYSRDELDHMLVLCTSGIQQLAAIQNEALAPIMGDVEAALSKESRGTAEPRDEKSLWGKPE